MDEMTRQCVREVWTPLPAVPGQPAHFHAELQDAEYERSGVGHLLMYYAPFDDWRRTDGATDHTASTWAEGVRRLVEEDFPQARRITLVLDNLSTPGGASLYKSFPPAKARALLDELELVYTPKHGSWLNMAELEFSVLARWIADLEALREQVSAWTEQRKRTTKGVHWRFATADARVKLHHLYPVIKD
jgi:transposase